MSMKKKYLCHRFLCLCLVLSKCLLHPYISMVVVTIVIGLSAQLETILCGQPRTKMFTAENTIR